MIPHEISGELDVNTVRFLREIAGSNSRKKHFPLSKTFRWPALSLLFLALGRRESILASEVGVWVNKLYPDYRSSVSTV